MPPAPPMSVMKSRRLMSDMGFLSLWRRRSVYRTLNLPQRGRHDDNAATKTMSGETPTRRPGSREAQEDATTSAPSL